MFSPLAVRSEASLNANQLSSSFAGTKSPKPFEDREPNNNSSDDISIRNGPPSSPFDSVVDQENHTFQDRSSPLKQWSPVKGLSKSGIAFQIHEDEPLASSISSTKHSTRQELSPRKASSRADSRSPRLPDLSPQRQLLRESGLQDQTANTNINFEMSGEDDTCDARSTISEDTCFTAFSAVPNADMTLFAALGNRTADNTVRSPTRQTNNARTPRGNVFSTPYTSRRDKDEFRSSSPTPRQQQHGSGDTTSLLLDFTQQFEGIPKALNASPTRRGLSPGKTQTETDLLSFINGRRNPSPSKAKTSTPSRRNLLNLLDFDLPPQPTPRSIPTITVRELESLKSTYLSEISSLKASLSGREAEVESLKKAVGDAERRVGEALETVRDERNAREHAEKEKSEWEKKGKEVEAVLNSVREEYLNGEKEKEDLLNQLEESNQRREEAELRAKEASNQSIDATSGTIGQSQGHTTDETEIARRVAQQLDEKMENLARELHAVYKKKHETKVGTLKKTYEARSEKKLNELHQKVEELTKQNEELQAAKDASLSGTFPSVSTLTPEDSLKLEQQKTEIEGQKAKIAGLIEEISSVKQSQDQLMQELEAERVEKGELVAAVDEMLALQSEAGAPAAIEDFRKSISRPASGLKGPGFGGVESKIGRMAPSGLARSASGSGKSKIMSNIERMGSGH